MMLLRKSILVSSLLLLGFIQQTNAQFENAQKDIIDVLGYQFYIHINDTDNVILAKAVDKILVKKTTDSIFLNLTNVNDRGVGMSVSEVSNKQGVSIKHKHYNDKLIIYNQKSWKANDTLQLTITYSGVPEDGLYIKRNKYGKRTFFGDNWPNRAHYWLPVIDHPSDKATVSFTILAPQHYTVIASGKLISKKQINQSENQFYYQSKIELPTKVMVFAAADFRIKEYAVVNKIPVSSWIFTEAPSKGIDDYKPAVEVLKFYDSIIGAYSYEKLANVQSKTRFGGMENAGNIFYMESSVDGKSGVEPLIAHEVAHQWFGDSVTEENWSDIWLSEGFATYLTDLYMEYKYGKLKLQERLKTERDKVILYSKNANVQAVVYDEKHNLMKLLNRNSYEKGAWILHMLRVKIGDKAFFKLLQTYYTTFKNKNATTSDFIQLSESISGKELQDFFKQWLYRKNLPKIKVDWTLNNGKISIDVQQFESIYKLDLRIQIKSNSKTEEHLLHLNLEQEHFEFKTKIRTSDIKLFLDPNVEILFENRCK